MLSCLLERSFLRFLPLRFDSSTLRFSIVLVIKFTTFSDILNIFQHYITHVCGIISYALLLSAYLRFFFLSSLSLECIAVAVIFSFSFLLIIFHWNVSDSKSPQVYGTFLSTLTGFSNAVVWIVSILPLIYPVHRVSFSGYPQVLRLLSAL